MGTRKMTADLFSCRIINFEYCTLPPTIQYYTHGTNQYASLNKRSIDSYRSRITNKPIFRSPVVRVFGPTLQGDNACVNIHGFYPCFYVDWPYGEQCNALFHSNTPLSIYGLPISGPSSFAVRTPSAPPFNNLNEFLHAMATEIDGWLMKSPKTERMIPKNGNHYAFVYNISIVLRRSLYGYEKERRPFLLIQMTDVRYVHEVTQVFNMHAVYYACNIMFMYRLISQLTFPSHFLLYSWQAATFLYYRNFYNIEFQPYEVHLIGLQFLADLNLRGVCFNSFYLRYLLRIPLLYNRYGLSLH